MPIPINNKSFQVSGISDNARISCTTCSEMLDVNAAEVAFPFAQRSKCSRLFGTKTFRSVADMKHVRRLSTSVLIRVTLLFLLLSSPLASRLLFLVSFPAPAAAAEFEEEEEEEDEEEEDEAEEEEE